MFCFLWEGFLKDKKLKCTGLCPKVILPQFLLSSGFVYFGPGYPRVLPPVINVLSCFLSPSVFKISYLSSFIYLFIYFFEQLGSILFLLFIFLPWNPVIETELLITPLLVRNKISRINSAFFFRKLYIHKHT